MAGVQGLESPTHLPAGLPGDTATGQAAGRRAAAQVSRVFITAGGGTRWSAVALSLTCRGVALMR